MCSLNELMDEGIFVIARPTPAGLTKAATVSGWPDNILIPKGSATTSVSRWLSGENELAEMRLASAAATAGTT